MASFINQARAQVSAFYKRPIVKNTILTTAAGLIASKGLQIANNSYHLVNNSSLIVNPSQIAGPLLLAAIAGHITKLVLNEILPNSFVIDDSAKSQIKYVTVTAVKVGTLMALAGPAGASIALIEALAFSYLLDQASSVITAFSHQANIPALRHKIV